MTELIGTGVHESVREHYAQLARSNDACCGASSNVTLYPEVLTAELPSEIAAFSLGCGDPITLAGLKAGDVIVDLGAGGGLDCLMAAKQVGETGRVIGVDMTPEMIAKARANAAKVGVGNVEFRQGYIEALPVANGEASVVISNCVINLSPDKPRVFREIFRVLKPGGRLAVSDIVTNGPLPEVVQNDQEAWSACVAGALEVADFRAGLEAAGFVEVSIEPAKQFGARPAAQAPFSALITARKPGDSTATG
ncbi:MAG: arsenite methyltransferase [Anaerolineales bacterium]